MGRGLSDIQREILDWLAWWVSKAEHEKDNQALATIDIVDLLGMDYTPSNRASVSRSLSRLQSRGMVACKWGWRNGWQHTGYYRVTDEQVKEIAAARAAFFESHGYTMIDGKWVKPE